MPRRRQTVRRRLSVPVSKNLIGLGKQCLLENDCVEESDHPVGDGVRDSHPHLLQILRVDDRRGHCVIEGDAAEEGNGQLIYFDDLVYTCRQE